MRAENSFCSGDSLSNQCGGGVPPSDVVPYHSPVGMETYFKPLTPGLYQFFLSLPSSVHKAHSTLSRRHVLS